MDNDVEYFDDGNMTRIVRRGDQVERALPQAWKASHAVLAHLDAKKFSFSPRVIRHDDTHEWLSFLPGKSLPADLEGHRELELLVQVGRMIRQYHDAVTDFTPPPDVEWPPTIDHHQPHEIICHNDVAPWNIVVDESGSLAGLIDWDLVGPGSRRWDLAYACWRFGLLVPGAEFGSVADRATRISTVLDAYRLSDSDRAGFVDLIAWRAQHGFDVVEQLGSQGVPGYVTLYEKGAHHWGETSMKWIDRHRAELARLVELG